MKYVKFYGLPKALQSWKTLVESTTKKACTPVVNEKGRHFNRYTFKAYITESDLQAQILEYWYVTESGHNMPWNHRISFSKH